RGGAIRVKQPLGDGGHGQNVATSLDELEQFLKKFSDDDMAACGLVLEPNLQNVVTRSVGRTNLGDNKAIAYHGTQRRVINNAGQRVYGGSQLVCIRGSWNELEKLPMDLQTRLAVQQAQLYDRAASEYAGFDASRRNYDVG